MIDDEEIINSINLRNENNIVIKKDKENIKFLDCEEIIKNYLNRCLIKFNKIEIKKTNEGLSNFIYFV